MAQRTPARGRFVTLHDELIDLARKGVGDPDLTVAAVVRLGLATLAGVDVAEWTPKPGRPRSHRRQTDTLPLLESESIAS